MTSVGKIKTIQVQSSSSWLFVAPEGKAKPTCRMSNDPGEALTGLVGMEAPTAIVTIVAAGAAALAAAGKDDCRRNTGGASAAIAEACRRNKGGGACAS